MSESLSVPSPVLTCSVTIENLTQQGTVKKSTSYKNVRVALGRNEFKDIMLQMNTSKVNLKFPIKNFNLHKRFMKEGKATIYLKDQLLNFMIANAPPNGLLSLIKVLSGKLEKMVQNKDNVPVRQRLLSNLPKTFDEISPLTIKEFESLRQRDGKTPLKERNQNIGVPGSSPVSTKRKRESIGKMSMQEKLSKIPKFLSPVVLNNEQKKVLQCVQSGSNIFFTGSAGTGKSFLLKRIVSSLPPDATCVTASTGIAACHIGGTTLHSFAGIGTGSADVKECFNLAKRKSFYHQWRNCKHLIIDEISMVDGDFFEKVEAVARYIKGNDQPFGGIQLILCGDFLQLPPITKRGTKRVFCFETPAWDKCINVNIELIEVKRQNDELFIDILQNVRLGRLNDHIRVTYGLGGIRETAITVIHDAILSLPLAIVHNSAEKTFIVKCNAEQEKILKETVNNVVERDGIKATRLCTHKEDVEYINDVQLKKLQGDSKIFGSVDSDPYMSDTLDNCTPVLGKLTLKVGAQVMLMKNLDVAQGLANGARGVVTSFKGQDGLPMVKFACGITKELKHQKWTVKGRGGIVMTRRQIPLKLAWAFSIHKSQGMTLDCVEMSLSKVFEAGQAYVALSRARNLESLRVLDFNTSCIRAHPDVQRFYYNLRDLL